ncbi:Gmad2 immunoglobulin-like domain-containing protein [Patescibacteria group bacterium]|nr:Gmad2 immunoglobulin-like domain-containing protein [Patescibacteria group bacterium]
MFKKIYCPILLLILAGLAWLIFYKTTNNNPPQLAANLSQYINSSAQDIEIFTPPINSPITSPLVITGQARGYWFFEASFPIKITDEQGNLLGQTIAQAQSDWMTKNWVPFTAELKFKTEPTTSSNLWLIFDKDNPSGEPQFNASLHYPILKSN